MCGACGENEGRLSTKDDIFPPGEGKERKITHEMAGLNRLTLGQSWRSKTGERWPGVSLSGSTLQ